MSAMLIWLMRARLHRGRAGRRASRTTTRGRPSRCSPTTRRSARHGRQPLHVLRQPAGAARGARRRVSTRLALVGMGCQTSSPPIDVGPQGRQGRPSRSCSTSACCARRRSTTRSSPSCSRPSTACKKQDMVKMNIKGVFQIWMKDGSYHEIDLKECHALDPRGLQALPRLRRRARRHLHRRHRRGQRLDAHDRAHRARRGGHRPDDRRRHDHRPPGPGGRGGDEAAAHAVDRVAAAAGRTTPTRRRRSACRRRRRRRRRASATRRPRSSQPARLEAATEFWRPRGARRPRDRSASKVTSRVAPTGRPKAVVGATWSRLAARRHVPAAAGLHVSGDYDQVARRQPGVSADAPCEHA